MLRFSNLWLTLSRTLEKAKNEKWFAELFSVFLSNLCRHTTIYFPPELWKEPSLGILLQIGTYLCTTFGEGRKNRTGGHTKTWNSHGLLSFIAEAFDTFAVKCGKCNSFWTWEGYSKPKYTLDFSFFYSQYYSFSLFCSMSLDLFFFLHQKVECWNTII